MMIDNEELKYTWQPDPNWELAKEEGRLCRMKGCRQPAVAKLIRGLFNSKRGGFSYNWWHYCSEHLYGRRIQNGKVEVRCRKPDAEK